MKRVVNQKMKKCMMGEGIGESEMEELLRE